MDRLTEIMREVVDGKRLLTAEDSNFLIMAKLILIDQKLDLLLNKEKNDADTIHDGAPVL